MRNTLAILVWPLAASVSFGQGTSRYVATVADLVASKPSISNPYVDVGAYSATVTCGAPRTVRYDPASTATVDNGCVFTASGGVGRWIADDCDGGQINVTWFGAPRDGVTDALSAVQAAVNKLSASGGTVYFPEGTYAISGTINVSGSVSLVGDGQNASTLKRIGSDTNAIVRFSSANSMKMDGFDIDCADVSQGVDAYSVSEGLFTRLNVYSFTQYGLKLFTCYTRVEFNRFRDASSTNAVGLLQAGPCSGNLIVGNSFGTQATGLRMDEPSNGLSIGPGNTFEDNLYGILIPRFAGGIYGGVQDLTIQANFFEANSISPLSIGWGPYTTNSYGHQAFRIMGNAFAVAGNGPVYLDSVDTMTVSDQRFGPVVNYGTNFTMLHLQNNSYFLATNKVINYANLAGKLQDFDGVVLVNAGAAPSEFEFKPYMLSGSLGLATANPRTRLDVFGPIRSTFNGPLPDSGKGLELFYEADAPVSGVIGSVDRDTSTTLPLRIAASTLKGTFGWMEWPYNVVGSVSNPPANTGRLWFTNVSGGTNIALVVRSPSGVDTILGSGGSGTSTNSWKLMVSGANVDNPNLTDHPGYSEGYFEIENGTNILVRLFNHGTPLTALSTNGAALYSLQMFDGTNWVATTNLGTLFADTLVIRSNFVGTLNETNIDSAIARLASPAFTGTPTAPTAADGTSNTVVATTEFVMKNRGGGGGSGDVVGPASAVSNNLPAFASTTGKLLKDSGVPVTNLLTITTANATFVPLAASTTPVMSVALSNQVSLGAPTIYAGSTSVLAEVGLKAPLASPTFTGTPAAPTPSSGDNSTKLATTAWVMDALAALDGLKGLTNAAWRTALQTDFYGGGSLADAAAPGWSGATVASGSFVGDIAEVNHPAIILGRAPAGTTQGGIRYHTVYNYSYKLNGLDVFTLVFKLKSTNSANLLRTGYHTSAAAADPTDGVFGLVSNNIVAGFAYSNAVPVRTASAYSAELNTWYRYIGFTSSDLTVGYFALLTGSNTVVWADSVTNCLPVNRNLGHGTTMVGTNGVDLVILDFMSQGSGAVLNR